MLLGLRAVRWARRGVADAGPGNADCRPGAAPAAKGKPRAPTVDRRRNSGAREVDAHSGQDADAAVEAKGP